MKNNYQTKPAVQRERPAAQKQNVRSYPQRSQVQQRDTVKREKESRMRD